MFTGLTQGLHYNKHGIGGGNPAYERSQGLEWFPAVTTTQIKWGRTKVIHQGEEYTLTDKMIHVPNPMIDSGTLIPGFNDDYAGEGPDIGAFERGRPPIKFGRRAGRKVVIAPWEAK